MSKSVEIEGAAKRGTFTRLLGYAKPYAPGMAVATLMVLAITALELYKPFLLGKAIDTFVSGHIEDILKLGVIYIVLLVLRFVFTVFQARILQFTGQKIVFNIRQELMEHVHSLSLSFFDVTPVGRIVTRVTNDVEALNDMFSNILVRLVRNIATVLGLVIVMFSLAGSLTLRSIALMPVIILLAYVFRRVARTCYRITRSKITTLNIYLSEHLSGMRLIQIFSKERIKNAEFDSKSLDLYRANFREVMVYAVFRPLIYFLYVLALVNVINGGAGLVLDPSSGVTAGLLYTFIQYVGLLFDPIQELAEQLGTLQQAFASAEKIFALLDEEPGIPEPITPVHPREGGIKGRIEFDHVWFAYVGEEWILKDVSFTIEPGRRIAFVGATGAGKTTILSLVGRYYDVNKGRITIDGIDIRDMDKSELRRAIGQVQQDVFVFTGDIAGNIRLMNDEISDEQIRTAARIANADEFIRKLEHGYEEAVTERGSTLSAGQRQLLSFARTLAFDPKILVMDEATANIDTETEQLITEAMERLMSGRTTIMVAHRLSTIQHCDRIMVMHKGRLVEQGTHQELLALNGIYKKLYELQHSEAV